MAHLIRIIPDSKLVRGYLPTGDDLRLIDQNTFLSINGDDGGTWAPSDHITINGEGVVVAALWVMNGAVVNAVGPFTFGKLTADDYWQIPVGHGSRTCSVLTTFIEYFSAVPTDVNGSQPGGWFAGSLADFGICTYNLSKLVRFGTPLNVYNGGTITDVVITFRVNESHLPQFLPRFRVVAMDKDGTLYPLRVADSTLTDSDGYVTFTPTPDSAATWFHAGTNQTFTYSCNQNQLIDTSKYTYYVEIIEEGGSNSFSVGNGNCWRSAVATFTNIPTIDGRT